MLPVTLTGRAQRSYSESSISARPHRAASVRELSAFLPSWRLHLEAANLLPRTIRAYTDDGAIFVAFLARPGMPPPRDIHWEHVEAFTAAELGAHRAIVCRDARRDPDRDVQPEDPLPGQSLHGCAADDGTAEGGRADDAGEDPHHPAPAVRRKRRKQQREACGRTMAVPMPWTARGPISTPMDGASAQAGGDAVNKVSPATRTRRLPSWSPADAAVSSSTATVNV